MVQREKGLDRIAYGHDEIQYIHLDKLHADEQHNAGYVCRACE